MTDGGNNPDPAHARALQTMLRAVAGMASRSVRAQADVDAALRKVGLSIPDPERQAMLAELAAAGMVENLIPLSDGAILLTVTPRGLLAGRR